MIDTLTLTPIAVPRTSDGPDARDFVAAAEVLNRSVAFDIGSDHLRSGSRRSRSAARGSGRSTDHGPHGQRDSRWQCGQK